MSPARPVALAAGCLALSLTGSAGAEAITLLSPAARATPPPPLSGSRTISPTVAETRFPGRMRNAERIVVGLDASGSPVGVVVTQRLTIVRPGDFTFVVPAPATKVVAAAGSQAEPGLRDLGIVWQGFSSGRRVLAATATLTADAAAALPLRIAVARQAGVVRVRLADVALGRFTVVTGSAPVAAVRAYAARLRALEAPDLVVTPQLVLQGRVTGQATLTFAAPIRVRGTISVPGRSPVAVSEVLGGGRPLTRTITLPGRAPPRISLRVEPLGPLEIIPPPDRLASTRDPLAALQRALGQVAMAWQYRHFLDSPDALGPSRATYLFRTAAARPIAAGRSAGASSGGNDAMTIVLVSVLGAAALVGGAVLWAHL
jgi:hypothetical protein